MEKEIVIKGKVVRIDRQFPESWVLLAVNTAQLSEVTFDKRPEGLKRKEVELIFRARE
jgi:hypothetical protein